MLCYSNVARQSNIDRIKELIDVLGAMGEELGYFDYRALVDYLNVAKRAYEEEMTEERG